MAGHMSYVRHMNNIFHIYVHIMTIILLHMQYFLSLCLICFAFRFLWSVMELIYPVSLSTRWTSPMTLHQTSLMMQILSCWMKRRKRKCSWLAGQANQGPDWTLRVSSFWWPTVSARLRVSEFSLNRQWQSVSHYHVSNLNHAVPLLLVSSWPVGQYQPGFPVAWYTGGVWGHSIWLKTTAA